METTPSQIPTAAPIPNGVVMRLTERATSQVKEIIKAQGFEGHFLIVRVVPSGCSGFGYDLNLAKETRPGDLVWEQDGVRLATDEESKQYLVGTEIDYVTGLHGAGFKFANPNAKSSCGCGSSFNA